MDRKERCKIRKNEIKKQYIECAAKILRSEGQAAVTIRNLGSQLGHNSATLYSYFKDLDELMTYVAFKFRREYLLELSKMITSDMSATQQYIKLYEIYCEYSFSYPYLFLNIYFGPYSKQLKTIFDQYYDLFPEEYVGQADVVNVLLSQADTYKGDQEALMYLAKDGVVKREEIEFLSKVIVRVHASYMYELLHNPGLSITIARKEFMDYLLHILQLDS